MPCREVIREQIAFTSLVGLLVAFGYLTVEEAAAFVQVGIVATYRIPLFPVYSRFDLGSLSLMQCWYELRFEMQDVERLRVNLRIPDVVRTRNGTVASGTEALCLVLARLAYPCRWVQLVPRFGRSITHLSQLFNETIVFLDGTWQHLLAWPPALRSPAFLATCSQQVAAAGAPLANCVGFLDGTLMSCATPTQFEAVLFSGHKHEHGFKFQNVTMPNGLIVHQYGPHEGRRTDAYIFGISGLRPLLQASLTVPFEEGYRLYADGGYALCNEVIVPFRRPTATPAEMAFNTNMSHHRAAAEWSFANVASVFAFVDFEKNLRLLQQPIALYYRVATLLVNCRCCLYGNETSSHFQAPPPTLEAYLAM